MLVSDMMLMVQETVQDVDADRYKPASIIRAINFTLYDLRNKRPDMFIGTYDNDTPQVSLLTDRVPVPDNMLAAMVAGVVGWVEMRDDEYTSTGRAAALMEKFATDAG